MVGGGGGGVLYRNLRDDEKDLPLDYSLFDNDARDQKGFFWVITNSTNTSHASHTKYTPDLGPLNLPSVALECLLSSSTISSLCASLTDAITSSWDFFSSDIYKKIIHLSTL